MYSIGSENKEEHIGLLKSGPSRWLKSVIDASVGTATRYSFLVCTLSILIFCIAATCQWALLGHAAKDHAVAKQLHESKFETFSSHVSMFFFTVFSGCVLIFVTSRNKHRSCTVVSATISFVAGVAHFLIGQGLSPISICRGNMHAIVHFRWAEWLVCVPLMTFVVCDFLRAKYLFSCMGVQFLVILLGYISEILFTRWLKLLCFFASSLMYAVSMLSLYFICSSLGNYCEAVQKSKKVHTFELSQRSVYLLCKSIAVIWTIFPLVFLLNMFGYVSELDYVVTGPLLDLFSKAVFLGVLFTVHSQSDELQKKEIVDELKEKNNFQAKFLRFVYHEIRNPFNTIMLGLDHLLSEIQIQEHCHLLITLQKCARSVNKVVDDAVELTKNQASLEVLMEPISIEHLVYDAVGEFSVQSEQKGVLIKTQISKNLPILVYADYTKMKKLFEILISNGVKFSSSGGVVTVTLIVEEMLPLHKMSFIFSVIDHGPGINEEIVPFLFEPFGLVRPGDFSEDEHRGSGLGLCMAKHLADLLSVKIAVSTKVGNGSDFKLYFTLEACPLMEQSHSNSKGFFTERFSQFRSFNEYCSSSNNVGQRKASWTNKKLIKNQIIPAEKGCSLRSEPSRAKGSRIDRFASSLSSGVMGNSSSQFVNSCQSASFGGKGLRGNTHNFMLPNQKDALVKGDFELVSERTDKQKKRVHLFSSSSQTSTNNLSPRGCCGGDNEGNEGRGICAEKNRDGWELEMSVSKDCDFSESSETISEIKGSSCREKDWFYHKHGRHKNGKGQKGNSTHRQAFIQVQGLPRPSNYGIAFKKSYERDSQQNTRAPAAASFYPDSRATYSREESLIQVAQRKRSKESDLCPPGAQENMHKELVKLDRATTLKCGSPSNSSKCSEHASSAKANDFSNVYSKEVFSEGDEAGTPPRRSARSITNRDSGQKSSVLGHSRTQSIRRSLSQPPPLSSRSKESCLKTAASMYCSPRGKAILIVDDVCSNARLADMILTKAGFRCTIANNGQEAVDSVCLQHFELILMDNVMPIMNGIEATRRILALKPATIILGVTGNVLQNDQDEFLQAGAKHILQKPIDRIQLLNACNNFLYTQHS